MSETDFFVLIALVMLVAILIVVGATLGEWLRKTVKESPKPESHDDQFRIVELQNGTYRVEQYRYWYNDWGTPEDIGPYEFDTLSVARWRKAQLVARMVERDGYRTKRVVG